MRPRTYIRRRSNSDSVPKPRFAVHAAPRFCFYRNRLVSQPVSNSTVINLTVDRLIDVKLLTNPASFNSRPFRPAVCQSDPGRPDPPAVREAGPTRPGPREALARSDRCLPRSTGGRCPRRRSARLVNLSRKISHLRVDCVDLAKRTGSIFALLLVLLLTVLIAMQRWRSVDCMASLASLPADRTARISDARRRYRPAARTLLKKTRQWPTS